MAMAKMPGGRRAPRKGPKRARVSTNARAMRNKSSKVAGPSQMERRRNRP